MSASASKRRKRNSQFARGLASALVSLAIVGCKPSGPNVSQSVARVGLHARPDQIEATGAVKPQVGAEVKVGPRISGTLKALRARVGHVVCAGCVLAELDSAGLKASLAQAFADREAAEIRHELAMEAYERLSTLAKSGLVSAEAVREAELAQLQTAAVVRKSRASEDAARIELSYATIRAPITGTVASISTQTGETVAASLASPTFVTIIDLTRLQVVAFVDEVDIARLRVGQSVTFSGDAVPDKEFHGAVVAISPAAQVRQNVVSFEVVASILDDSEHSLRPEMSVSARIATGSALPSLTVPADAVQRTGSGTFVEIVSASGVSRRTVVVGWEDAERAEIRSGIVEGEQVLRKPRRQKGNL